MRDFTLDSIVSAHGGPLPPLPASVGGVRVRAAKPTPDEIYRVCELLRGKPSMLTAHQYLLGVANKDQLEQTRKQ